MALSGTLETFSLPDVLRLLSSTKKTGLLALDGDRGRGHIWVRDGAIVAADADRAVNESLDGVAFELLRFADAGFEFESGVEASSAGDPHDVDEVLAEAGSRLAEWREIEAVVPSLDVWVRMVAELDAERAVSPAQWRVLAQVGTGAAGHALADRLDQGEYEVCRQLRDLVADGMVELDDAPLAEPAPAAPDPVLGVDVDAAWNGTVEPTFLEPAIDPVAEPEVQPAYAFGEVEPITASDTDDTDDPAPQHADDEDDFLSQLSQLSPKAAAAVEATWTEDAPAAAEEATPSPAGDDVDQNLLLRFLSSAKG